MFFTLRRILYILIVFHMNTTPCIQLQMMLCLNLLMCLYSGSCPLHGDLNNCLYLLEEFTIQLVCCHLLCFTDWVGTLEVKTQYGWSMIIIISMHIGFILLLIAMDWGRSFALLAKKLW